MALVAIAVSGKDLLKPACWRTGNSLGITQRIHQIPGELEFNAFARNHFDGFPSDQASPLVS
jgi:hypothetical protein